MFGDCGVCCAAMLARTTRSDVVESVVLSRHEGTPYLSVAGMAAFLASRDIQLGLSFGIPKGTEIEPEAEVVSLDVPLDWDALVTVPGSRNGVLHFVVWNGTERLVYDPSCNEPRQISKYQVLQWDAARKFVA